MLIFRQRIESHLARQAPDCDDGDFPFKGNEPFQDCCCAVDPFPGRGDVCRVTQELLTLAIVTQGAGFQDCRQANFRHGLLQCIETVYRHEGCGVDAQLMEQVFLTQAIPGGCQRLWRWIDRQFPVKKFYGFCRHTFKFVGDPVHFPDQAFQCGFIVKTKTQMLAQWGRARMWIRAKENELETQRIASQCQHAGELAATKNTDFQTYAPSRGSGWLRTRSV